jgi:hypothetical protein
MGNLPPVNNDWEECTPEAIPIITLAPIRVFIVFAVQATIPPITARAPAKSRKYRLPNLSDRRPVIKRLIALHVVQTMTNRLAF